MREKMVLQPHSPPEGVSATELLLWEGRCPWCALEVSFAPTDNTLITRAADGSIAKIEVTLVCMNCGFAFDGCEEDMLEIPVPTERVVRTVRETGDPEQACASVAELPAPEPYSYPRSIIDEPGTEPGEEVVL